MPCVRYLTDINIYNNMINITFPDGSVRAYESGITAYEIANGISPRLAADVMAATVIPR